MPADHPNLRNETKFISSKVSTDQGKILHEVNYQGKPYKFLPEQVTGAMFGKIK